MSDSARKDMANGSDLRLAVERSLHRDLDLIVLEDDIAIRARIRLEDFEQCVQGRDLPIRHYEAENGHRSQSSRQKNVRSRKNRASLSLIKSCKSECCHIDNCEWRE